MQQIPMPLTLRFNNNKNNNNSNTKTCNVPNVSAWLALLTLEASSVLC